MLSFAIYFLRARHAKVNRYAMNVRTISQLPEITTDFDNGLFEVSVPNDVNDSRRHSRSIKYSTMKDNMLSAATDKLVNEYGLEIDD